MASEQQNDHDNEAMIVFQRDTPLPHKGVPIGIPPKGPAAIKHAAAVELSRGDEDDDIVDDTMSPADSDEEDECSETLPACFGKVRDTNQPLAQARIPHTAVLRALKLIPECDLIFFSSMLRQKNMSLPGLSAADAEHIAAIAQGLGQVHVSLDALTRSATSRADRVMNAPHDHVAKVKYWKSCTPLLYATAMMDTLKSRMSAQKFSESSGFGTPESFRSTLDAILSMCVDVDFDRAHNTDDTLKNRLALTAQSVALNFANLSLAREYMEAKLQTTRMCEQEHLWDETEQCCVDDAGIKFKVKYTKMTIVVVCPSCGELIVRENKVWGADPWDVNTSTGRWRTRAGGIDCSRDTSCNCGFCFYNTHFKVYVHPQTEAGLYFIPFDLWAAAASGFRMDYIASALSVSPRRCICIRGIGEPLTDDKIKTLFPETWWHFYDGEKGGASMHLLKKRIKRSKTPTDELTQEGQKLYREYKFREAVFIEEDCIDV